MWSEMSLQTLEAAYSPSSVAPGYQAIVAQYRSRSEPLLRHPGMRRLPYGRGADEYALLFEPENRDWRALLVYFHGGYWQELSAEDSCFPAPALLERGIAYAAVNYTLAPAAGIGAIVQQCRAATAALAALRPGARMVLAGSSAGAHLAAMAAADPGRDPTRAPVAGAVLLSGIYDLRPLVPTYINQALDMDEVEALAASPQYLPPDPAVVTLVGWGSDETDEFKRQSAEYAAHLLAAGAACSSHEAAGRNHFDIPFDLTDAQTRLGRDTFLLLGEPA